MTLHQFKAFCFRGETGANLRSHQLRAADTDRLPSWCCSAIRIDETWSASSLPASPRAVNIETGPTHHRRYNKNKGSSFELKSSRESKIACRNKNKSNETALLVFMCVRTPCTAFSLHATLIFPTPLIRAFPLPVELFKVTDAVEVLLHFASTLVLHTLHPWQQHRMFTGYSESSQTACFTVLPLTSHVDVSRPASMHSSCAPLCSASLAASPRAEMTAALCWQAHWTAWRLCSRNSYSLCCKICFLPISVANINLLNDRHHSKINTNIKIF